VSPGHMQREDQLRVTVDLSNTGGCLATETVQLYLNDPVASTTRPVKELKAFQRVTLAAGEHRQVQFTLSADDLAFTGRSMRRVVEPGRFHLWVGGSSEHGLHHEFTLLD
jgi:beta-glucosidase